MSNQFTNVAGFKVTNHVNATNLVDYIIEFESGLLDDEDVIALFQYLVDSGQAWSLQGSYGRAARSLIEAGHVYRADDLNRPGVIDVTETEPLQLNAGD
jgi:hypothetical protein